MDRQTPRGFSLVGVESADINPMTVIGNEWMLVTAGDGEGWNTMTAAWGGLGFLWRRPVVFAFVRYSRYTYEFMERQTHFSLSFFGAEWREVLTWCGTHSGRDSDKAAKTGLRPLVLDTVEGVTGPAVGFEQADTMFVVRKLYSGELSPAGFIGDEIHALYSGGDYHRMYVGGIEAVLVRDNSAGDR